MDCLHHPFQDWIKQFPHLLGIAVGEELHRALEVGKEHRHLFAFPFKGRLGDEDPLGEVLGRVNLWGGESRFRHWLSSKRLSAGSTELPAQRYSRTTGWAGDIQLRATLLAEADARPIVEVAMRAKH